MLRRLASMRVMVLALLVACTPGEQSIIDTSHAPFALQADGSITAVAGTPAPAPCASGRPLYAWSLGRFITISSACTTDTGWSTAGNLERPLACDSTADCPQWRTWSFECRSGVCQNVDTTAFPPAAIDWDVAYEL